jgi:hypothetical protein
LAVGFAFAVVCDEIPRPSPSNQEPSFSAGNPENLFQGRYRQMDVTSDHQRFIAAMPKGKDQQDYLNVVMNSLDEVRKLLPIQGNRQDAKKNNFSYRCSSVVSSLAVPGLSDSKLAQR